MNTDSGTTGNARTVCPYCGVGCGMTLHVENEQVVKISGDKEHPTNFGRLCTKGSSAHVALRKSGRLEHAFVRRQRNQDPVPLPMAQAITDTARRLRAVLDAHGPDALSFYVSGRMSIEAQYLINKLAKGYVGTNHIESNSRLCMASAGTFLADRAQDINVPVFVQKSAHFRPPHSSDTPMIMVGPGTGVAPFRGFLHEQLARGDSGRNWLFFGEQHAASDFYYRDELETMRDKGLLTRLDLAFSRDQADKIYVQDRMREHGAELWAWLEKGAHFYVCGDASRMAKDVDAALKAVVQTHGGLSLEAATAYVSRMASEKRYVRDVY